LSGLETAIRNALEKSDRANPDVRARIYQSARQALESGMAKQGVTDSQVVTVQRQRLELKIREIEGEERARPPVTPVPPVRQPTVASAPPTPAPQPKQAPADAFLLGGAMRDGPHVDEPPQAGDQSELGSLRAERRDEAAHGDVPSINPPAAAAQKNKRSRRGDATVLDARPKRSAKPRRRRSVLSVLAAWLVFFALIGAAAWWAYSSGLIRQSMDQAIEAASQSSLNQQNGQGLGPQVGFSDDWLAIFDGTEASVVQASGSAVVEPVDTASGPALRLTSTAGTGGDISVAVPADILRQLAGKTSTIALTAQSGADAAVEFSVSCDFGSLGTCSRHRFTAHQEKADSLFRVTFDQSSVAETSGRLLLSTSIAGDSNQILLYAVRVLPGQ